MMLWLKKVLMVFLLATLLLTTSCATQPPSRFEQAQRESTQRGATSVVKEAASGGSFNKFFPKAEKGYERVYTQEKKGFAEAKLKKDGRDLAVMAISDTLNNPSATLKFKQSPKTIGGYPAVEQGSMATAVLVNDRYQVKVLSRNPTFTQKDRQAWLEKFDLKGLARLKK